MEPRIAKGKDIEETLTLPHYKVNLPHRKETKKNN